MEPVDLRALYVPAYSLEPAFIVRVEITSEHDGLASLVGRDYEPVTCDDDATMRVEGRSTLNGMQPNSRINTYLHHHSEGVRDKYPASYSELVLYGPVVIFGVRLGIGYCDVPQRLINYFDARMPHRSV
jgi:hypothetical protein